MKAGWIKSQTSEMDGLWRRGVFRKVLRSSLTPQDRVFTSRFHYKIKRKGGEFDKCKVRLVVQGQHMRRKGEDSVGDYDDAFSPVPAASGFRTILSLATQQNMFTDHVDISQAFVQGELLPGDGHNGKVYISSPPGYDQDPLYVYRLLKPLYGMPSAARAWHTTMSAFLAKEGCATVGFEKSMWTVTIDGARILLGAHIDDFVIACTNRQILDDFRTRLLDAFEGTYEGALQHYLGCEVTRDMAKGTTYLSQTNYAEEILRTYNFWNATPRLTPIQPSHIFSKKVYVSIELCICQKSNTLQHTAAHCNTLQHIATHCKHSYTFSKEVHRSFEVYLLSAEHTAASCCVLQCIAVRCSVWQRFVCCRVHIVSNEL